MCRWVKETERDLVEFKYLYFLFPSPPILAKQKIVMLENLKEMMFYENITESIFFLKKFQSRRT